MNRFGTKISAGVAGIVVILGILVAVNALVSQTSIRKDLTEEKLYTLSSGTRQLLGQLNRDVTLKLYYSKNAEGIPVPLKQYAQRIIDLLHEIELHSNGRVALEIHDPEPDSNEEEWAQRYGIAGQSLNPLSGPRIYLGLVAVSGAKEAVIPFFAPDVEPQLEYLITRLVNETITTSKPKIGVLTALPVMGAPAMPYAQSQERDWAFMGELKRQFNVVRIPPNIEEIPADLDTVLVIHPRDFPDVLLFAIDQFVLRGGKLIAFTDPVCLSDQEAMEQQSYGGMSQSGSDLNRFAGSWGFAMDTTRVVADQKVATLLRGARGQADRNPAWLSLRKDNMNHTEISSSSLEFLMLPFAGAFTGKAPEGVTSQPLFTASAESGFMSTMEVMMGGQTARIEPAGFAPVLAVKLNGHFKTAFPDGRPTNSPAATPANVASTALKESSKDGVVVLIGDVDMLSDNYAVRRQNFFGQEMVELANDNINFVANLTEQMSGSDYLISLRSRGSFERPFEKVMALEAIAQERWKAEETKLQEQLQESQRRLSELEQQKDASQKLIITAEQKAEIEKFRKQQFDTSRQLREVRRNLRADIESLGMKLKVINIALVPGLVALFGITRGMVRRRRSAQ